MRDRRVLAVGLAVAGALLACVGAASGIDRQHADPKDDSLVTSARVVDGRPLGVGRLIASLEGVDLSGKSWTIAEAKGAKAIVIAMTSASCPVSRKYVPSLAAIEKQFGPRGVRFVFVNASGGESEQEIRAAANQFRGPYLFDKDHGAARALGARSTAEVFVLDGARTLVYRGAMDDQYGLGYSLAAPRQRFLSDALDAALAGKAPAVGATSAPGCLLESGGATSPSADEITWHNRISRIVQGNCVECHRAGGIAPFSLESYGDVAKRSKTIASVVEKGIMPPWFAAAPEKGKASPWLNDRSLLEQDKADLLAWLGSARAEGEAADAPAAREFPAEWSIGTPDVVLQLPKPQAIKASGVMPYVLARIETGFETDKWVRAMEVQPTARQVVHHVLVFALPPLKPGQKPADRFRDGLSEARGFFAAYVPGNSSLQLPEGMARHLPKGSTLLFQIHYTPNGTATTDQTRLALKFADKPPEHEVQVAGIADHRLRIPPGAPAHQDSATLRLPADTMVMALMPHMHLRGKAFRFEATLPDGTRRLLLDVPRYDFNWQLRYDLREPMLLPKGTVVRATGTFDNSAGNPANPDPTVEVRWGQQTTDEMMLGYVQYYLVGAGANVPARED